VEDASKNVLIRVTPEQQKYNIWNRFCRRKGRCRHGG
jgi:hypothetical protein